MHLEGRLIGDIMGKNWEILGAGSVSGILHVIAQSICPFWLSFPILTVVAVAPT